MKKILFLFLLLLIIPNASATWWNYSFNNRVTNYISDGYRPYQIQLNISNDVGTNNATHIYCNGACLANFNDIRFTLDNTTLLSHYINTTTKVLYVNLTANGTLNMYYNFTSANSVSNSTTTFRVFDDFNDGNYNGWNLISGSWSVIDNHISTNTDGSILLLPTSFDKNSGIWEARIRSLDGTSELFFIWGFYAWDDVNTQYQLYYNVGTVNLKKDAANIATYSGTYDTNWHNVKIIRNSSNGFEVFVDGVLNLSVIDSTYTQQRNFGFWQQGAGRTINVDDVMVRDHTDVVPVLSTWGGISIVPEQITTLPATLLTTKSATLNLERAGDDITPLWFQYGLKSGIYTYKTDNVTLANGVTTYSKKIEDFPLQAGQTYYYRAMAAGNIGNESSFTLPRVSQITGYEFDTHYNETVDANFNITEYGTILPSTYTDLMGGIFYGIIIFTIFVIIWIRQEDIVIPALLGILCSFGLFSLMPDEYLNIAFSLMVVSLAGLIYSYFWGKR